MLDEPIEVRRKVGYLPENVPLYTEMRAREYLDFRAKLKDVPRSRRRAAIDRVVERCGLAEVEHRILGQLSKGFRQRVGLAEAMVHDPDILILDEPTAGLDPIQIREVRALIRELGDRHTILLSTHILSEVEAVCGRVIIIARGRIAVDDRLDRMRTETRDRGRGPRARRVDPQGPGDDPRGRVASSRPASTGSTRPSRSTPTTARTPRAAGPAPGAERLAPSPARPAAIDAGGPVHPGGHAAAEMDRRPTSEAA